MKDRRMTKLKLRIAGIVAMLLIASSTAMAQCAMCKNAVTGSPSAAKLSESLNSAIIVLLIPPVLIFCGLFLLAYRYRKGRAANSQSLIEDDFQGQDLGLATSGSQKKKQVKRSDRETGGALA